MSFYNQVQKSLISTLPVKPKGNALKRLNTLSGLITGMIRKGSSHMPAIGSGIAKDIDANSKTIAATRFVENKWTDYQTHYLPFLTSFLQGMILSFVAEKGEIILVIDGSQAGKDNAVLMISLVWRKRGIPLCWYVKSGSKGHFTTENHVDILQKAFKILLPLVPKGVSISLLGDGEFDGIELQKCCKKNGCNYALRTARSTIFYKNQEQFQSKEISPTKGHDCVFITGLEFTKKRFKWVNFVCWHDIERHEEPIFLVSNLDDPGDIIELYDQRYSIECLFKDIKSTSFNIHKTRLKKPYAISNLLIIAALAFLLLTTFAHQFNQKKYHKKVHRVRNDRKVCSFFTFAYLLIDHFIDNGIPFNFSFQFSKNE